MFKLLFSRRWFFTTLLVFAAILVMVRLGKWQLDRLEQRRNFNRLYMEQSSSIPLELTPRSADDNLASMEYREIIVTGHYDNHYQVAIRNQYWDDNKPGVHLLSPLLISGSDQAILVDRGWIPLDAYQSGSLPDFDEPGDVLVHGIIRLSQSKPAIGGRPDPTPQPGEFLEAWNFVNIEAISKQIPFRVLPVYIQQSPDPEWDELPYRSQPIIEISEGPHLGYAIQWFIFAAILGVGYPIFIRAESFRQHSPPV